MISLSLIYRTLTRLLNSMNMFELLLLCRFNRCDQTKCEIPEQEANQVKASK